MSQDEIFKLLLIILLMSNDRGTGSGTANCNGYGNINEIIIFVLFMHIMKGCDDTDPFPSTTF